jgi:hypothetical protein
MNIPYPPNGLLPANGYDLLPANRRLNTPKTRQINDLFLHALGIERISVAGKWDAQSAEKSSQELDGFIEIRGQIAHRGVTDTPITREQAEKYFALVKHIVSKTGGKINFFLRRHTRKRLFSPV